MSTLITRADSTRVFLHFSTIFFGGPQQAISLALDNMDIHNIRDFLTTTIEEIEDFEYEKDDGTAVKLKKKEKLKLKKLLKFAKYLHKKQFTAEQWLQITEDDYDDYAFNQLAMANDVTPSVTTAPPPNITVGQAITPNTPGTSTAPTIQHSSIDCFLSNFKLDI